MLLEVQVVLFKAQIRIKTSNPASPPIAHSPKGREETFLMKNVDNKKGIQKGSRQREYKRVKCRLNHETTSLNFISVLSYECRGFLQNTNFFYDMQKTSNPSYE